MIYIDVVNNIWSNNDNNNDINNKNVIPHFDIIHDWWNIDIINDGNTDIENIVLNSISVKLNNLSNLLCNINTLSQQYQIDIFVTHNMIINIIWIFYWW